MGSRKEVLIQSVSTLGEKKRKCQLKTSTEDIKLYLESVNRNLATNNNMEEINIKRMNDNIVPELKKEEKQCFLGYKNKDQKLS